MRPRDAGHAVAGLALLALVLPGCTLPSLPGGDLSGALTPHVQVFPLGKPVPWTDAAGDPWLAYSHGCDPCAGRADDGRVTLLWETGQVLSADYGPDGSVAEGQRARVAPYLGILDGAFATFRLAGTEAAAAPLAVSAVWTGTLAPADRADIVGPLRDDIAKGRPPRQAVEMAGCPPVHVETHPPAAAGLLKATCGWDSGDSVLQAAAQLALVEAWVRSG